MQPREWSYGMAVIWIIAAFIVIAIQWPLSEARLDWQYSQAQLAANPTDLSLAHAVDMSWLAVHHYLTIAWIAGIIGTIFFAAWLVISFLKNAIVRPLDEMP